MADPLSALGAAASIITIVEILSKSISLLDTVTSQWNTADLALNSLNSQLRGLNGALGEIHKWQESVVELHHQLDMDLKCSLDCCHVLVSKVYEEIAHLGKGPSGALLKTAKARLTFKRKGLSELQTMIDRQVSTLNLLLTACNSNSPAKQQNILCCSNARKHIDAIQRDSASLVSLVDSASFLSTSTGRTSKLSMLFDFDDELFISKPYENFIRKTVKFSIRSQKRPRSPANGVSETASVSLPSELLPEEDHKGIVLLGPGSSSKTTFLKQVQAIYTTNHSTEPYDYQEWKIAIYDNLRIAFRLLFQEYAHGRKTLPREMEMIYAIDTGPQDSLPAGFAESFQLLYAIMIPETGLPKEKRGILESIEYLVADLPRVCAPDYRVTAEDAIRARVRTTGIHPHVFHANHREYCMYDVGGERSERKKWLRGMVERAAVAIFFVPMSGYFQPLYEDRHGDLMHESLMLFESIVNSKTWLARSKFILCFTKMDIFERDIRNQLRSIDKFFPDYSGCPTDIEAGKAFFTAKFTGLLHTPRALDIYYINATDTGEVRLVLDNILNDRPTFPPHQTFVKLTDLDTIVE